jgi:hypothetical protein
VALKNNRTRWGDPLSRTVPTQFEELLANYYREQGYRVEHVGAAALGKSYDGGIDLKLYRDDRYLIVQCKRWTAKQVPHNAVHELIGVVYTQQAQGAILVTSGEFTRAAREAAAKHPAIELIDGAQVRAMLGNNKFDIPAPAGEWVGEVGDLVFRRVPKIVRKVQRFWFLTKAIGFSVAALLIVIALTYLPAALRSAKPSRDVAVQAANREVVQSTKHQAETPSRQTRRPQQAGQPVNPLEIAGHVAGARIAAATGNQDAAAGHVQAIATSVTRSARMYDPHRPINCEAARQAVRPIPGVRSAIWLDSTNFVVMVDGSHLRSSDMIDTVCLALEPLGDTLAVVVNIQDVTATTRDGAHTLSRNCQLAEGQRAFMQPKREVDVVSRELRDTFKGMQTK